ncbi:MAG: hypothetical protein K1W22_08510 [Lachnospiraceae bacterium]
MERARRRIRVCLICVVMAAVIVGFIYYFNDVRDHGDMSEGTLVQREVSPGAYSEVALYTPANR